MPYATSPAEAKVHADTINRFWAAQGRVANARVVVTMRDSHGNITSNGVVSDCVNGMAPMAWDATRKAA